MRFGGKRGVSKGGCKSGYRRLTRRLGGDFWRVQTGWMAVGGGQKRLAGLTVIPKRVRRWGVAAKQRSCRWVLWTFAMQTQGCSAFGPRWRLI